MHTEANHLLRVRQVQFMRLASWVLLMLGLLLSALGCGSVTARSRVTETIHIELKPEDYEFIKTVEGKSCVGRYLFFLKFYTPDPLEAASNAMRQAPEANWLVNRHVTVEEEIYVPLIYHRQCIWVEGDAVKVHGIGGD